MRVADRGRPLRRAAAAGLAPVLMSVTLSAGGSAPGKAPGTAEDQLDPVANDHILARLIPQAKLVLYPDAGHRFLFQEVTPFFSSSSSNRS